MSSRGEAAQVLLNAVCGRPLRSIEIDLERGTIELRGERGGVRFVDVVSATLLGPWDGASAIVESAELVHDDGQRFCVELALRYPEVPRRYRVVSCGIEAP